MKKSKQKEYKLINVNGKNLYYEAEIELQKVPSRIEWVKYDNDLWNIYNMIEIEKGKKYYIGLCDYEGCDEREIVVNIQK